MAYCRSSCCSLSGHNSPTLGARRVLLLQTAPALTCTTRSPFLSLLSIQYTMYGIVLNNISLDAVRDLIRTYKHRTVPPHPRIDAYCTTYVPLRLSYKPVHRITTSNAALPTRRNNSRQMSRCPQAFRAHHNLLNTVHIQYPTVLYSLVPTNHPDSNRRYSIPVKRLHCPTIPKRPALTRRLVPCDLRPPATFYLLWAVQVNLSELGAVVSNPSSCTVLYSCEYITVNSYFW